jgi:flagellar basal-body rod protein FlgB
MTEGIEAITTAALGLALDAASLRHQAIAANIANHATEGYVPQKLDFEAQLANARRSLGAGGGLNPFALSSVKLQLQPVLDESGAPAKVHLDAEVSEMARNSVHFQALARALSRHFAILGMAASDGKK